MSNCNSEDLALHIILKEKLDLLQQSYEITIELKDLIDNEQYEVCLDLIMDRQTKFDMIDKLNNKLRDQANLLLGIEELNQIDLEKIKKLISIQEYEYLDQLINKIDSTFKEIVNLDQTCEMQINKYKEKIITNLNKLEDSRRARKSYHKGYFVSPRFIDKKD